MRISEREWLEDFKEFVSSNATPVPKEVSAKILQRVHASLNPSPWLVFAKMFGIHAVVGTVSLSVCNQFGLNPFRTSFSLSDYFMRFGHSMCMVLCGVLFIGLSVALARVLLSREEFSVLARNAPLQVFALSVFSIVAFLAFGADIVFGIGVFWLIGAMFGGISTAKMFANAHVFA